MERIKELINNFDGKIYDLCYELLNEREIAAVFEYVCKNFSKRLKEKNTIIDSHFTDTEIEEFESVYGDVVNGLLNTTIKKCNFGIIDPNDFYNSLWASYCTNFTSQKELAFAFYYTLIDQTIPYQYLGKPISMSNDRFKEIIEKNEESIEKVKYILKSQYSQRTEDASLLLNCLDAIDDFESKTVVLAQAIMLFNRSRSRAMDLDDLIKKIDERIEREEREQKED